MLINSLFSLLFLGCMLCINSQEEKTLYKVGVGIADVTGGVAEVGMMGYGNPDQKSAGIHLRLFSRAFIFDDGQERVVFVSVDCGMMSQLLKIEIMQVLEEKYGGLYTWNNVGISGTHSHSGAGGFLQYFLFQVTTLGYIPDAFQAYLNGIVRSIDRAHNNMQDGYVYYSKDVLYDANINRSPSAYLANPLEERERYDNNTDQEMLLLRIDDVNGNPLGSINWFAVHGTSMNNTNKLISSDNKGYAAVLFEQQMNPGKFPGKGSFVSAFASTNLGDVSPNTNGPHCQDTGLPCDISTSTCNGRNELCVASGPGDNMFESTEIIAQKQFNKAVELFNDPNRRPLSGPVTYTHQFVNITDQEFEYYNYDTGNITKARTCKASLGYSFAAGTTDGPGAFNFTQGTTTGNPFWDMVRNILKKPTDDLVACQKPKPILLATGEMHFPYEWHPAVVETQILRIGNLFILVVPGEFTTMAGRRLRNIINETILLNNATNEPVVVIAGLSNVYSHYITTYEEYQVQRYEGASTLFGPHTHSFYLEQYKRLVSALILNETLEEGPSPPNLLNQQITLQPPVIYDAAPIGHNFGDCVLQPYPLALAGEAVIARFIAGHPRNNPMQETTYLLVELSQNDTWTIIATDASWETKFNWVRTNLILGYSEAVIEWDIPTNALDGEYRIRHFGYYKPYPGADPLFYYGTSNTFTVQTPRTFNA